MCDDGSHETLTTHGKINVSVVDSIGWVTFDNQQRHNAFTQRMWIELPDHIKSLEENKAVRIIVLKGAGEQAFCAGADISEFDVVRKDTNTAMIYEQDNVRAFDAIYHCSKPVIAMINGNCFGGGFGIAAAADIRIASDNAVFSVPAAKLGLAYPIAAISNIVDALGEQTSKELLFSARKYSAEEMVAHGFLLNVFAAEQLSNEVTKLATAIAENAPISIRAAKQAINALRDPPQSGRFKHASETARSTFESQDYREGRAAFKQRRKPVFTGS